MRSTLMRRTVIVACVLAAALMAAGAASAANYVVMYKASATPADSTRSIQKADGKVVANYDAIGVVVASSLYDTFQAALSQDNRVSGVARSDQPVAQVGPLQLDGHDGQPPELPNAPAGQDSLAPLQWDMRQIKQPQANAITGGSPAVVVGDIDTGVDKDHPDLVQNIDFSRSASCEFGIPNQAPAAWDDHNGHGTHTTGTMAAAANGFGITGVAPNVKIAATKSSNDDGYFFVDMVVCSFMWAGGAAIDIRRRRAWTSPRPSGRAWTSRTTATSWIPGSTTAGTMLASGCCGRPPSARSTSRSRGVSPTSPRRATRATTSRIPRSTTGAPTRVPLRNVTSRMPVS